MWHRTLDNLAAQTVRADVKPAGRTIRRVLYMATLSALKAKAAPQYPSYERLRANGKPFKVAITAAMRKFIVMLNAMIKNNQDWMPKPYPASTVA